MNNALFEISSISLTHLYALGGIPTRASSVCFTRAGTISRIASFRESSTPSRCAVVKDWTAMAEYPFARDAKHILSPELAPMSWLMCLTFSASASLAP
ncbi:hypothetical protein VPNG_05351 [Cytospora leucostoma]|uniref:Uncharacterized protein n=1 Tax=Cytospora leucostoma TaxID=1230097 RepID=A0A423X584_9PEZI|nr:hypothetical protein VPNG_05351 [Cytospora leucostoma]